MSTTVAQPCAGDMRRDSDVEKSDATEEQQHSPDDDTIPVCSLFLKPADKTLFILLFLVESSLGWWQRLAQCSCQLPAKQCVLPLWHPRLANGLLLVVTWGMNSTYAARGLEHRHNRSHMLIRAFHSASPFIFHFSFRAIIFGGRHHCSLRLSGDCQFPWRCSSLPFPTIWRKRFIISYLWL
jgi:hypothetical protein